jgi:hypothetical protein
MKFLKSTLIALLFGTLANAQNVGIGTSTPDEKLQVDSTIRVGKNEIILQGSTRKNLIKFGDGNFTTIGEQGKDDRLVLNASSFSFTNGKVGIGVDSARESLDVVGTIRISDGTQGLGKVLTSDANGKASWQSSYSGNTDRFSFFASNANQPVGQNITYYNTSTITPTIFSSSASLQLRLTFNKAGLYHFSANAFSQLTNVGRLSLDLRNLYDNSIYYFRGYVDMTSPTGNYDKEIDVFVPANYTLSFDGASTNSVNQNGGLLKITVTGYLIAE